jgi:pimeloyl-ACP methyl ester carboxylesterase
VRAATAVVAGHRLAITEGGTPGAPAFVLVHGIGMSASYFRPFTEVLERDGHVLVPDLPGFGSSPKPAAALGVAAMADVVAALIEDRGLASPVLVGHSMGCQVVAELLAARPGVAAAGVLIGPVVDDRAPSPAHQALRLLRDGRHEPLRVNATITADYMRCGPRWYVRTLPHMLSYPILDRVAEVEDPLLVVRGAEDPIAPADWVRRLAAAAPRGTAAEVRGAGHVAMYTHPEEVKGLCQTALR